MGIDRKFLFRDDVNGDRDHLSLLQMKLLICRIQMTAQKTISQAIRTTQMNGFIHGKIGISIPFSWSPFPLGRNVSRLRKTRIRSSRHCRKRFCAWGFCFLALDAPSEFLHVPAAAVLFGFGFDGNESERILSGRDLDLYPGVIGPESFHLMRLDLS